RDELLRRILQFAQIRLDEQAPHGGWCAEAGDVPGIHLVHQGYRVKALVVVDEYRGFGDPWGEEIGPSVFSPARGSDIQMDIAGFQPNPEHRAQVPHRV